MADLIASIILQMGKPIFGRVTLPKASAAEEVLKGVFLKSTAGVVAPVAGATDDATFCGIAAMLSADAEGPLNVLVYTRCIVEVPMTAASYIFGQDLKYKTDGTLEDAGGANTIAWAWETKTVGAGGTLKVLVDVVMLAKLFTIVA